MINTKYVCPNCKKELVVKEGGLSCIECERLWKVRDGVPVFLDDESGFWGEIPREKMVELNEMSKKEGWRKAIPNFLKKSDQLILQDSKRAAWKYLIGLSNESRVLDIGCGWGALSFSLAKTCNEVYSLEPVWERMHFVSIRREQDGVHNLFPLAGRATDLPFPDNYLDLVVLNGVLEWVGFITDTMPADKVQEHVLREIRRVLKPDGTLYIGIENRFAAIAFLGAKDAHTGLPFITLMPRPIAHLFYYLVKKGRYATYLYSFNGYRNLLERAGYEKIDFYAPLTSYRLPKFIFPLAKLNSINYFINKMITPRLFTNSKFIRILLSAGNFLLATPLRNLSRFFALDFSIAAAKSNFPLNEFKEKIITDQKNHSFDKFTPDMDFFLYNAGWRKQMIFCFLKNNKNPSYIWKIATDSLGEERMRNECLILGKLAESKIHGFLPRVSYEGVLNNEYAVLLPMEKGDTLSLFLFNNRQSLSKFNYYVTPAVNFLIDLQQEAKESRGDTDSLRFKEILDKYWESYQQRLQLQEEEVGRINSFIENTITNAGEIALASVFQHRDFQPENIIYNTESNKIVVLDWEYALEKGLPLVDLFNFLYTSSIYIIKERKISFQSFSKMMSSLTPLHQDSDAQDFEHVFFKANEISDLVRGHINNYCRIMGISKESIRILFLVFILEHLDFKKGFLEVFMNKESEFIL